MQRSHYFIPFLALGACLQASLAHAELECTDTTALYTIQGASHVSTYDGQVVETCGVVTAVAFSGYYLQDADGDGDDSTSDGIFVSQFDDKPDVGTQVRLSATVSEFISGGAATGNLSTTSLIDSEILESMPDVTLPEPVLIGLEGRMPPAEVVISESEIIDAINLQDAADAAATPFNPDIDAIDFYESLEGMRVSVANPVAISGIKQFGSFSAEVFVLTDNGLSATPADARTSRGGIRLQPDLNNRGDQNPERVQIQFDSTLFGSTDYPEITVGDTLDTVTGVMSYSFGNFEVIAVGPITLTPGNLSPTTIAPNNKQNVLSIASYNVLNLSGMDADDEQRSLIAAQITDNMQLPDIIGLQEVQDSNGDSGDCPRDDSSDCAGVLDATVTLERLVADIVTASGVEYAWLTVDPLLETTDDNREEPDTFGGASLGNIRNAFLYNPARVSLVSHEGLNRDVLTQRGVSTPTAFDTSRDPLEAVFEFNGEQVTVFNNHFSSRFGSSPIFGGPQPFIQAGEENRAAQSLAMKQLTIAKLAADPQANVVILGDLNTFEFTDELSEVLLFDDEERILFNLIDTSSSDPYSYIFEGNSQALDHIFVSSALMTSVSLDYVHVNVDFPDLFTSTVGSDHEPIVARMLVGEADENTLSLSSEVYSETAAELFWDRSDSFDRYEVYRDGVLLLSADAGSYFDDSLQAGTSYRYTLDAYSGSTLVVSESQEINTDPRVGPGLDTLTGEVYSSSALELFWSASELSPAPVSFEVVRDGELVASTDGRSFFDDELQADTRYYYTLTAIQQDGRRSGSTSLELMTRRAFDDSANNTGPGAVNSLSGLVYSSSAIEVFWEPPASGTPAVSYQIWRNEELIETRDARSFFDSGLQPDTSYQYTVTSVDASGNTGVPMQVGVRTAGI
ncbi:endonuclease/exonuclease/phosphatase family protein [Granulosicoccus antarcticus]|uniref:Exoglucanase B n=1 Tax=Granulosicoccus antarcticus IMCC3135 TaxID=1192854 RepID=A0A2Z2NQL3_9GAMM|nr:endonuclease/exonuclease/phosphatase family protein [Granulosicoccus antarcticus]ASJ71080.1 Exoglucanase B [Granulosicoccus antarcticus IMCC3135]